MVTCKIKVNFITPDPHHYLNFVVGYNVNLYSTMNLGKTYLIGTKFLLKDDSVFSIKLDNMEGVKFKYLIRKYMKDNWKVKVTDLTIKHINNIKNNHNYLVLVNHLNKNLKKIKNRISSLDKITWRTFYEMYIPYIEEDLDIKVIYNKLGTNEMNTFKININDRKTRLTEIYTIISKII